MGFLDNTTLYSRPLGVPGKAQPQEQQSPYAQIDPSLAAQEPQKWESASESERQEDYNKYVEADVIAPNVHVDLKNRWENSKSRKAQSKTIEEMKAKLAQFSKGPEGGIAGSLGPMNKLFDFMTDDKYKMSQRFGSGVSAEEREKLKRYMQSDITKAEQDLGKQENQFYKSQLLNRFTNGQKNISSTSKQTGSKAVGPAFSEKELQDNRIKFTKSEDYKDATNLAELKTLAAKVRQSMNEYGGPQFSGPGVAVQRAAYRDFITRWNEAVAKLGALSGPDKEMIESIISVPTDATSWAGYVKNGKLDGIMRQLDYIDDRVNNQFTIKYNSLDETFHPQSGAEGLKSNLIENYRNSGQKQRMRGQPQSTGSTGGGEPPPASSGAKQKASSLFKSKRKQK